MNPNDADAHYDLGKIECENGDSSGAISELENAVLLAPAEPRFHHELATAYRAALRPEDAAKESQIYEQLVALQKSAASDAKPDSQMPSH